MLKKLFNIGLWVVPILILGFLASDPNTKEIYENLKTPAFAPPSIVFPIVWWILYILIGYSGYLYKNSGGEKRGYILYFLGLALNFLWPVIFFTFEMFTLALVIIIALDIVIYLTVNEFLKKNKTAGNIFFIYLLWCLFATLLNLFIIILN